MCLYHSVRLPGCTGQDSKMSRVPQDIVVDPLLFLIMISDINKYISSSNRVSFADDTRVYTHITQIETCVDSKRHTLQVVELCSHPQQLGPDLSFLGKPAMRTRWMAALFLIKAGDVETNPGPTTTHKDVWIAISAINKYRVKSRYR